MHPANSDHGRALIDAMAELDRRERAAREAWAEDAHEIIPPTGGLNRPDIAIRGTNYRHPRKPEMAGGDAFGHDHEPLLFEPMTWRELVDEIPGLFAAILFGVGLVAALSAVCG